MQTIDGPDRDTLTDIELLDRIAARDPQAVSDLYDRHRRLLFGLILRILRDRSDAEEVLQEVFITVWTRAETFNRSLGSPIGWLVGITRNRAIDRLRANKVRPVSHGDAGVSEEATWAPAADNPESSAVRSELEGGVSRALAVLPADQRTLIEQAYYLGLTHSELAERFALPLGTVKTRIRTCMMALRRELEPRQMDHGSQRY